MMIIRDRFLLERNTQTNQVETKFRRFMSWSQPVPSLFKVICIYGKYHLLYKQIDYNPQTRAINVKEVVIKNSHQFAMHEGYVLCINDRVPQNQQAEGI